MPTRIDDVVIVHIGTMPSLYVVWLVLEDGQQTSRHVTVYAVTSFGAALTAARGFAGDGNAIYICEHDGGEWKLVERRPQRRVPEEAAAVGAGAY